MEKPQRETLVTNGLGGYSLTALGDESFRKYHGLFTVSRKPPVDRIHILSKLEISQLVEAGDGAGAGASAKGKTHFEPLKFINLEAQTWPLVTEVMIAELTRKAQSPNRDENKGTQGEQGAEGHEIAETHENQETLKITRNRAFAHGTHNLALRYTLEASGPVTLKIEPHFNVRDHHDALEVVAKDYGFGYYKNTQRLSLAHPLGQCHIYTKLPFVMDYHQTPPTHYAVEVERGYPHTEDHMAPGYYLLDLEAGTHTLDFMISNGPLQEFEGANGSLEGGLDLESLKKMVDGTLDVERERLLQFAKPLEKKLQKNLNLQKFLPLIAAADHFIVHRETTGKESILAGYPWFTDWGRDTMIALPGLCLTTGRFDEALEMIETFIAHQYEGIIPNNFPDAGEAPMYNTADATLWLYQAMHAYVEATGDLKALEDLYPSLEAMLNHHVKGTINSIFVDPVDGLMSTGDPTTQLTWMDVKVNGWVVTPRHGKAIEINALYYNALCVMGDFSQKLGRGDKAQYFRDLAANLYTSFNERFWNDKTDRPYDLIIDGVGYDMIRPNMLLAISLPYGVLARDKWKRVVDLATEHLYLSYGLRSLSPADPEYHGRYAGDLLARDGAYHRGTGWGWLLGPYLEAHLRTWGDAAFVKAALDAVLPHLEEGCIGSIAENFDGDAPHAHRGCCAQAWSVAEVLRLLMA